MTKKKYSTAIGEIAMHMGAGAPPAMNAVLVSALTCNP